MILKDVTKFAITIKTESTLEQQAVDEWIKKGGKFRIMDEFRKGLQINVSDMTENTFTLILDEGEEVRK